MVVRAAGILAATMLLPFSASSAAPRVEVPADVAIHVPADLRSYFIAFKVTPAKPKEMSAEVFAAHQAYIRQQVEKKVYQLVGPVTDGGRIRGLTVLTATSVEEARTIVEADPAVQAKVLDVEIHPAVFPNLDSLIITYPAKS